MCATDVSRLPDTTVPTVPPAADAAVSPALVSQADSTLRVADRVLTFVDRHRVKLFILMGLLYLAGFNGQWRPEPDSGLYLTIGRNLASGEGYTYHGHSHRLVFPGLPLIFAGLFRVFGTGTLV